MKKLLLNILTTLGLIVLFIPGILYFIFLVVISWGNDVFAGDFDEGWK